MPNRKGTQVLSPSQTESDEFQITTAVLIYIEGNTDDWRVHSSREDVPPRLWLIEQRDDFRALDVKVEMKGTPGRVYRLQVDTAGGSAWVYDSETRVFR